MTTRLDSLLPLFETGGIVLLVLFTLTWLLQLKTGNAAIVDSVWAMSFPVLAIIYLVFAKGYLPRELMMVSMVMIWGLRLSTYLFFRTVGKPEDVRYVALREKWGDSQNVLMLRFFYFQAILALVLSLPFAIVMINTKPALHWIEYSGIALWTIGVIGESLADRQLKNFKADPANKGKICEKGLWYYSRHPNYFFEWLIWVSYFVTALGSPWGFLAIICPVLMLYFLMKVTGIPYTEIQMAKSRGEAYKQYQETTSAFIPLPKKKTSR